MLISIKEINENKRFIAIFSNGKQQNSDKLIVRLALTLTIKIN